MLILGIETSCDETSIALVQDGRNILSNIITSQHKIHSKYSGVVPELASRAHIENINYIFEKALDSTNISFSSFKDKVDAIAFTNGPGLAGSLLIGSMMAQTLGFIYSKPIIPVNHLEGHIYAALLNYPKLKPPYLSLIVSGGHTELIFIKDFGVYEVLGSTRDDAAGEAFDKVAKLLDIGYPGGPVIDRLSSKGDSTFINFPRPYLRGTWDFSFSGLKTAIVYYVMKNRPKKGFSNIQIRNICASFQQAVIDTLIEKTISAAKYINTSKIVLGGGVVANTSLRKQFISRCKKEDLNIYIPSFELCTDNAAMISCAGYYKFIKTKGMSSCKEIEIRKINPGLKIKNWC